MCAGRGTPHRPVGVSARRGRAFCLRRSLCTADCIGAVCRALHRARRAGPTLHETAGRAPLRRTGADGILPALGRPLPQVEPRSDSAQHAAAEFRRRKELLCALMIELSARIERESAGSPATAELGGVGTVVRRICHVDVCTAESGCRRAGRKGRLRTVRCGRRREAARAVFLLRVGVPALRRGCAPRRAASAVTHHGSSLGQVLA